MRARSSRLLLLTAWLFATGVHLDVTQIVAWARMFAEYGRVMPAREALKLTFSPEGMCDLCHAIVEVKTSQPGVDAVAAEVAGKAPLVFARPETVIVPAPAWRTWTDPESGVVSAEREAPPAPPPRGHSA